MDSTVADSARLTGLIVARCAHTLWLGAVRPLRGAVTRSGKPPARLVIAPQDIRTADPTVAADIYAGYFVFEGTALNTHGRSPFSVEGPTSAWAASLASFGWLRHLRAADTSLARANARVLVGDWISQAGRPGQGPAWAPQVVSRRILAWLSQSPIILDGADGAFYRKFMRSLGRQTAYLQRALRDGLGGESRLFAAIALVEVGLCAEASAKLLRQATRVLVEEIGVQILADGGHISRDPGILVDLLLDLLPLRQAFAGAGALAPPSLLNAIDRMMLMVRTFRHGDGALALFNGMGVTRPDALATVLAYDDARGPALANAPYSGYQRLERGRAILLMDVGRPPPVKFSQRAHAGTLAFEFSVGPQRVIVNCGAPNTSQTAAREAARATAAHSTLVLADSSSSRFASATRFGRWLGGVLFAGPGRVPVSRAESDDAPTLEASHDGYLARFGYIHRRRVTLARSGEQLEGLDSLVRGETGKREVPPDTAFAIRFHLHHGLRVQLIRNGTAAILAFPTGELWHFEAAGLPVEIEESIYFASPEGPRRIEQLVVRGQARDAGGVAWSLRRNGAVAPGAPRDG